MNEIKRIVEDFVNSNGLPPYMYADSSNFKAGETPVLYSGQYWDVDEISAAVDSLLTGKWLSAGEKVRSFENEFSDFIGDKYGVMVNSGSSANLIMMAALKEKFGWKDGDGVIVSPVGFPTTISVIVQNGLRPIFVDIEMETLNFNTQIIEDKIKFVRSKVVAIFVSPVLGNPPNFDDLEYLCRKYNLQLVLDCCDSLGSKWDEKYLNQYAIASSHSFYPAHIISTMEGGMITTSDWQLSRIARSLSSWGRACFCYGSESLSKDGVCNARFSKWLKGYDEVVDHKYIYDHIGYNLKPMDLQGAIGLAQLKKIEQIISLRIINRTLISKMLSSIKGVSFPTQLKKAETVWFGTPVICETSDLKRDLVESLENNFIQTRNYFAGNLLLHKGFQHLDYAFAYPNANKVLSHVFFLGASPHYNKEVLEYIGRVIDEFNIAR